MKSFARADRVSSLIQEQLSALLKKSIRDPRLKTAVVTGVKMSPDLKLARIYFVVSDYAATREEAIAGFQKAKGYIKYSLAQQLNLRYMPDLRFYYDESIDYGFHMDAVLKQIVENDAADHQSSEEE